MENNKDVKKGKSSKPKFYYFVMFLIVLFVILTGFYLLMPYISFK